MIGCLHLDRTDSLNKLIRSPENSPEWIAQGTTYLLPKSENTKEPRNYRPITCLATMYKLLTSIISERTYNFREDQKLLPTEQKGCRIGSYGCKDQLLVNKMILNKLIHKVKQFSDDIKMEFGLDKCAKASFVRGLLQRSSRIQLNYDAIIRDLENEEVYKYLGVDESGGIQHSKMKENVRKEYYRRIRADAASKVDQYLAPFILSITSRTCGKGYESFFVASLSPRKSHTKRILLSFFSLK